MRKALKIVIVVIVVIVGLFIVGGLVSTHSVNTNADEIAGITQFVVIKDGSINKIVSSAG